MSLRDQLLQAGIATKKQHQQARTQKKQQQGKKQNTSQPNKTSEVLQEAREAQIARDKALNKQREEERAQKALQAQFKQLITSNAMAREKGETLYRFTHHKKVKTLYLSPAQSEKIIRGNIAIASLGEDNYYFIPWPIAKKLEEKDNSMVVVNNRKASDNETEEDDPYAGYEIPDDLMW